VHLHKGRGQEAQTEAFAINWIEVNGTSLRCGTRGARLQQKRKGPVPWRQVTTA
jgi:hypothetical protein